MKPEMKQQTGIPTKAHASRYFKAFLTAALLAGSVSMLSSQHSVFAAGDQAANTTQQGGRNVDETMVLENRAGVRWELQRTHSGWSLGTLLFHGKLVEQSATKGLLALRNVKNGEVRWLAASQGEKVDLRTARLSGQQEIDGVKFSWTVDVELRDDLPAAIFTSKWSVDKDLNGWEVCLAYHEDRKSTRLNSSH